MVTLIIECTMSLVEPWVHILSPAYVVTLIIKCATTLREPRVHVQIPHVGDDIDHRMCYGVSYTLGLHIIHCLGDHMNHPIGNDLR